MSLEILDAVAAEALGLAWPDWYFSPGYGRAVEVSDRCAWRIAVWQPGPILFPFLLRPVPDGLADAAAWDVVTPYGYTGTTGPAALPPAEWVAFRRALREALVDLGCVAEFHRQTALLPGRAQVLQADPGLEGRHHNDTFLIDTTVDEDAWFARAEGRMRTKTRKAEKLGYTFRMRAATADDVAPDAPFRRLYDGTMRGLDAASYYLFPDAYYARLAAELGPRLRLAEVVAPDGRVGVSGLFVEWAPTLHAHLVGNDRDALRDGAGNLLYDGAIRVACRDPRFGRVHVGGGLVRDDALAKFKRGLGGESTPFWIVRGVLDRPRYDRLVARRAEQVGRSVEELVATGYFPAYRAG